MTRLQVSTLVLTFIHVVVWLHAFEHLYRVALVNPSRLATAHVRRRKERVALEAALARLDGGMIVYDVKSRMISSRG